MKLIFKREGLKQNTGRKHSSEAMCIVVNNGHLFNRLYKVVHFPK
jgi:hypothetical protein